jgi:hypothetical protein
MSRNGTVDRIESAANITLVVSRGAEVGVSNYDGSYDGTDENIPQGYIEIPISRLDTTKEVEISEIRESSLKASGYAITSISYSGTMMFKGSRVTKTIPDEAQSDSDTDPGSKAVTDFLYDDHGVPMPVTININHGLNDEAELYKHVLASSESYEVRSEEATETAFDWVAMDRDSDQPDQN